MERRPFCSGVGSSLALYCGVVLLGTWRLADMAVCPAECRCPNSLPCPPGIPLVLDNCGCCKVCARQFNQDCGTLRPCDHARGLRCQVEAKLNATTGICRASIPGRPCLMNGRVYQHGEIFKQTCRLQCTCKDGKADCSPLCPSHISLPPAFCKDAQLVKLPGTCCKRWKCTSTYSKDSKALRMGKWKEMVKSAGKVTKQLNTLHSKSEPRGFKRQGTSLSDCLIQNTMWTTCSQTCGMGISTRLSTNNTWCQPKHETRLCQMRPCDMLNGAHLIEGRTCRKSVKELEPRHFAYQGCISLRKYKPKYCGLCTDGRCCQPVETRTTKVRFRCLVRGTKVKSVMKIQRCECSRHCEQKSALSWPHDRAPGDSSDWLMGAEDNF
ncbi:CCN family member 1-like [Scyliorhinus canicula]|uniref:CCN family member 1-like n=1 Tax=Scyliorhinus canicula TaxID=7830 RepID=UPI0018F283DF|nr:CCN family member 1-like [Scyliorhinus canicula]XP_038672907.1 CCN family member 1-like [Scyliorhinus canicula]